MKELDQHTENQKNLLAENEQSSLFARFYLNRFSGNASAGDDNPYNGLAQQSNAYKLAAATQSDFFKDPDDFYQQFTINIDAYADPELIEEEENRKRFAEFSQYMFYVLPTQQQKRSGLQIFDRRLIVQFDAKRKRFLNQMAKSDAAWSTSKMNQLIKEFGFEEAYQNFLAERDGHVNGVVNQFSESLKAFDQGAETDEKATFYTKDEFKEDKEWYYLGLRNQMTRQEQFLLEQKLYNEFSLYISLKTKLLKREGDEQEIAGLKQKASEFIDAMYGDGLNSNFWGQAKYFRLIQKHFPDYTQYLTEQRNFIKQGLTTALSNALQSLENLVKEISHFISSTDVTKKSLQEIECLIEERKGLIFNTQQEVTSVLKEYAPEKIADFNQQFNGLVDLVEVVYNQAIVNENQLGQEKLNQQSGLIFLQNLSEDLRTYKEKVKESYKVTNVYQLIQPIAILYKTYTQKVTELSKNIKLNEEIQQWVTKKYLELDEINKQQNGTLNTVDQIKQNEIERRKEEEAKLRAHWKKRSVEAIQTDTYQLAYNGDVTQQGSYWDFLVSTKSAANAESHIDVEIKKLSLIDISPAVVDKVVNFLFGKTNKEDFEKQLNSIIKTDISSIYNLITLIESEGMGAISEKFKGVTQNIYETETPLHYLQIIEAVTFILSRKERVNKEMKKWRKTREIYVETENKRAVEFARNKQDQSAIQEVIANLNNKKITGSEAANLLKPYLQAKMLEVGHYLCDLNEEAGKELASAIVDCYSSTLLSSLHYDVLSFLEGALANDPQHRGKVSSIIKEQGMEGREVEDYLLKEKALSEALRYIEANPKEDSDMYHFAGWHAGEPGLPIDCSGMVSQCVQFAGGGYLNSVPTIDGKKITNLNGVGNVINQPTVWKIDKEDLRRGDLITMSTRVKYKDVPTGHVAFIASVIRDKNGEITEVVLYHSKGTAGPVAQRMKFDESDSYYRSYGNTFNYWRFGKNAPKSPQNTKAKIEKKGADPLRKNGEITLTNYTDTDLPKTVDFNKGKKYVENLTPTQLENLWALVEEFKSVGITDHKDIAAALSIISKESNFRPKFENMNYSKERLPEVWSRFSKTGKRVKKGQGKDNYNALAEKYERKPQALANLVYGGRYHNTGENDGWLYRGGGYNQVTFKSQYEEHTKRTGIDLVKNPELVNRKDVAANIAAHFFKGRIKDLKNNGNLAGYEATGVNDFPSLKNAVYAYYHANAGPNYEVSTITGKVNAAGSGMVKAQSRAPYLLQLLDQGLQEKNNPNSTSPEKEESNNSILNLDWFPTIEYKIDDELAYYGKQVYNNLPLGYEIDECAIHDELIDFDEDKSSETGAQTATKLTVEDKYAIIRDSSGKALKDEKGKDRLIALGTQVEIIDFAYYNSNNVMIALVRDAKTQKKIGWTAVTNLSTVSFMKSADFRSQGSSSTQKSRKPGGSNCRHAASDMVITYVAKHLPKEMNVLGLHDSQKGVEYDLKVGPGSYATNGNYLRLVEEDKSKRNETTVKPKFKKDEWLIESAQTQKAVNYIDEYIGKGIPVEAGVDHTYNASASTDSNGKRKSKKTGLGYNEGTTDHYITINGKGITTNGKVWYTFYDPRTSSVSRGSSKQNILYETQPNRFETKYATHPTWYHLSIVLLFPTDKEVYKDEVEQNKALFQDGLIVDPTKK